MSDERCIPPEELRGVDGWHWVRSHGDRFGTRCVSWMHGGEHGRGTWSENSKTFTYLMPIPTPSDLAAAKEREAALVADIETLRKLVLSLTKPPTQPPGYILTGDTP